jgi:hypothetical protein
MAKDNPIFRDDMFKRCVVAAEGDKDLARMMRLLMETGGKVALTDEDGVEFIELTPKALAIIDPLRKFS